jgi:hypothetical protein
VGSNVTHAGGNPAVTWALSGCQSNCGTLVGNSVSAKYTAPLYASATFSVTVTATAVADPSKSAGVTITVNKSLSIDCPSGNESALNGQYAFLLRGGGQPGLVALAGSFTADGHGNITAGLEDINGNNAGAQTNLTLGRGSLYSVGADNRGCLGVVNSRNMLSLYRLALASFSGGVADGGRIIEFDDPTGAGTRA